ncbi:GumC family protein [Bradyrhizobium sp. ORS 111]|uniref:GumC family protein n=1 Tax=Bradyrhizobium sp. ORS 111 TaxID=1685958 RepID=UPI00388E0C55
MTDAHPPTRSHGSLAAGTASARPKVQRNDSSESREEDESANLDGEAGQDEWELDRLSSDIAGRANPDRTAGAPIGDQNGSEPPPHHEAARLPVVRHARGHYPAPSGETLPAYFSPDTAYAERPGQEGSFDIHEYLWLLFKHRWLILSVAGIFLTAGLVWTLLTTPIYRASASLKIDRDVPRVVNAQDVQQGNAANDVEFYQTQYELLKSRSLAERVARSIDLSDDKAFLSAHAPSPWVKLRALIFGGEPAEENSTMSERQAAAAATVQANLIIQPVRSSSVVQISFDSPSAAVAARVVNAVQDSFIAENLERRLQATSYAKTFLEERIQELKVKLEDSEKELVAYADKQDIVDLSTSAKSAGTQGLVAGNLAAANDALTKATGDRVRSELLWRQAETSDGLALPQILDNKSIQEIRSKRAELQAEYQQKLKSFKPAFPAMVQLKARINELDRQVKTEVNLTKDSLKSQYEAAVKQEKVSMRKVADLKSDFVDLRNRDIQYNILKREVDTNRTLYDGLLQRYKEIGVAGGVGTNNISVVDVAEVPGAPYSPNLRANLLRALLLGLLCGGFAAFGREQLDDSFRSVEDVEENLGLPLLGIVPRSDDLGDPKNLMDAPRSAIAEAYRSLRTALQFSTASGIPKTLLVTSASASEGKSTTAYLLARNFAALGMRVLLIDCDLRKPSLNTLIGCEASAGLSNCLAGSTKPPEVFRATNFQNLTLLPSGPLPPNPAELLAGPKMLSLLTIASEKFDLVIVDGPPVAGLADAPILGSVAAGTLLLIEAGRTRRKAAKAAVKRLKFAQAQMVGAVLNKLNSDKAAYFYGYGYGAMDPYVNGIGKTEQLTHVE